MTEKDPLEDINESPFNRQERIKWWNQQNLFDSKILVIGAGALGNEVIKNLSLMGVGHMFIVDFDTISESNLSRAVLFREEDSYKSKAEVATLRGKDLNPYKDSSYNYLNGDVVWELGLGVYRHCNIVLGCLDNIEARLSVNLNSWRSGVVWIDGGMSELAGSVSVYGSDPDTACYECGMTPDHYRFAKKRYSCTNAVLKINTTQRFEPTTQITSAVIGALQSQEAIKILHGIPTFTGRRLMFGGSPHFYFEGNNPTYLIDLTINHDCICHKEPKLLEVTEISEATNEIKLAFFFELVHQMFKTETINLDLGCTFLVSFTCPYCDRVTEVNRPKHKVMDIEIICPTCEIICPTCKSKNVGTPDCKNCGQKDIYEPRLNTFHTIAEQSDAFNYYKEYQLKEFGIPLLQVLRINPGKFEFFVELTGDISKIWD